LSRAVTIRCAAKLIFLLTGLALVSGCANPGATDREHELRKAEAEQEQLQTQLTAEQSAVAALKDRYDEGQERIRALQRENAALQARVNRAEMAQRQLMQLLEQRTQQPLEQPDLTRASLPPPVDQLLRSLAQRDVLPMRYAPSRAAVIFMGDRLFAPGSAALEEEAAGQVTQFGEVLDATLREFDPEAYDLIVVGHTDSDPIATPEHPTNWHLSVHRAIAFKDALVAGGIASERIGVMGYGAQRPISEVKAENRRIELFLVPRGATQPVQPVSAE
jgi:chemotaxis protein MotB